MLRHLLRALHSLQNLGHLRWTSYSHLFTYMLAVRDVHTFIVVRFVFSESSSSYKYNYTCSSGLSILCLVCRQWLHRLYFQDSLERYDRSNTALGILKPYEGIVITF